MKKNAGPLLLLDCGGVIGFSQRDAEKKANAALESMTVMGYQGMNLGGSDFTLGTEFLKKASAGISFPFISTNAVVTGTDIPRLKRYEILTIDGVRIAVIGILPENSLNWTDAFHKLESVSITEPRKAITEVMPMIKKEKPDITVLLSQLDYEPTVDLVNAFPKITVAVSCGMKAGCNDDHSHPVFQTADGEVQPQDGNIIRFGGASADGHSGESHGRVMYVGSDGKHLGMLPMIIGADGKVTLGRERLKRLTDSVLENKQVLDIVNRVYYRKPGSKKPSNPTVDGKNNGAIDSGTHKELMDGLNLTPQEFMEQYRQTHKDTISFPPEIFQKKDHQNTAADKGEPQ